MQAAELAELQAGCSGAVQPQGGRFPLCVSEITQMHAAQSKHACTSIKSYMCRVENRTTIFGLRNQ